MNRQLTIGVVLLAACAALVLTATGAGRFQPGTDASKTPPEPAQMMRAWKDQMKPGKQQEELLRLVGTWNCVNKVYLNGPSKPPVESKGVSTQKLILGGKLLLQEYEGEMMGTPYTGQGLMGFDNSRKLYVSTWADSLSGTISYMTGGRSTDGSTYTSFGTIDEPWNGEIGKTVKYVLKLVDQDTVVFTCWQVMHAEDTKAFEIEYRRVK